MDNSVTSYKSKLIIIKYKDFGVETSDENTILKLKTKINKNGYIWCPWINNIGEFFPKMSNDDFKLLPQKYDFMFLNTKSVSKDLYVFRVDECKRDNIDGADIALDPLESTLIPFKKLKCQLWLKVTKIKKIPSKTAKKCLQQYFFENFETHKTTELYPFNIYDGYAIKGRTQLINQPRSIFFAERIFGKFPYKKRVYFLSEIVKETTEKYATKYTYVNGNSILLLSDLHCPFPRTKEGYISYEEAAYKAITSYNEGNRKIAATIISGDFSDKNCLDGYSNAGFFIHELHRLLGIPKNCAVFTPGNHDIAFCLSDQSGPSSKKDKEDLGYATEESKAMYKTFYERFYGCDPVRSCNKGAKLVLKNGLTVDILGLNSIPYNQGVTKSTKGFGYITSEHMEHAAHEMHWKKNVETYTIRILVFHHPLFPVGNRNIYDENYQQQTCINFSEIKEFIDAYNIDIVVTGHAHESSYLTFLKDNGKKCIWIGLGSIGASDAPTKSMECLDFSEKGKISAYIAEKATTNGSWQAKISGHVQGSCWQHYFTENF